MRADACFAAFAGNSLVDSLDSRVKRSRQSAVVIALGTIETTRLALTTFVYVIKIDGMIDLGLASWGAAIGA